MMMLPDSNIEIAGMEIFNSAGFLELVIRFALNLGVIFLLVRWLYYSVSKRKDYLFTYILISCIVFLKPEICWEIATLAAAKRNLKPVK